MATLQYFSRPGIGEYQRDNYWYNEAVRVGDTIECAGQGGFEPTTGAVPDDLSAEMEAAFTNVSEVIKHVLSSSHPSLDNGWDKVFHITSYHVNLDQTRDEVLRCMLEQAKKWCPRHKPTWTLIGVDKLALPTMRVEVEVRAYAGA